MSEGRALPCAEARRIADAVSEALAPACDRIEIAGSVRREKPWVHDLEIVAIPRIIMRPQDAPAQAGLFGDFAPAPMEPVNAIWEAIEALGPDAILPLKMNSSALEPDPHWQRKRTGGPDRSRMFKLWLPRTGMKAEIYMPLPEAWGGIFTIRTGSAEFSEALVTRWKMDMGGSMRDGILYRSDGRPVETPEEADFFRALRVTYIPPPLRLGAASLRTF